MVVGRLQHPNRLVGKAIQQISEAGLEGLRWVRGVTSDSDGPQGRGAPMFLLALIHYVLQTSSGGSKQ